MAFLRERSAWLPALIALLAAAAVLPAATGSDEGSTTSPTSADGASESPGNGTTNGTTGGESFNVTVQEDPKVLRYEFDHVEATYAASFQLAAGDVEPSDWALALAGPNRTLNVTFGVLRFWKEGEGPAGSDGFLKVEGSNGSRRFLGNSASYTFGGNDTLGTAALEFSSHKRLDGDAVVKDFTPPVFSVHLWRSFNATGERAELLASTREGWEAQEDFWEGRPTRNVWTLVPGTFREAGDPMADPTGGGR